MLNTYFNEYLFFFNIRMDLIAIEWIVSNRTESRLQLPTSGGWMLIRLTSFLINMDAAAEEGLPPSVRVQRCSRRPSVRPVPVMTTMRPGRTLKVQCAVSNELNVITHIEAHHLLFFPLWSHFIQPFIDWKLCNHYFSWCNLWGASSLKKF